MIDLEVAIAVVEQAIQEGVAAVDWDKSQVRAEIERRKWEPVYSEFEYDPEGEK
jgi:malate dehydrogenase (oxaloacetate-decarboxylating)